MTGNGAWRHCPSCGRAIVRKPHTGVYSCTTCGREWLIEDATARWGLFSVAVTGNVPGIHLESFRRVGTVPNPTAPQRCSHGGAVRLDRPAYWCPECNRLLVMMPD